MGVWNAMEVECLCWAKNYSIPAPNIWECHATLYLLSYKCVYARFNQ